MKLLVVALLFCGTVARASVDEPAGCWAKQAIPCAYRSTQSEWLNLGHTKLRTSPGGSFARTGESALQVLKGELWIESAEPMTISFGGRHFINQGEIWIKKENETLRLLQFSGVTQIQGSLRGETLPTGFMNWWSLSGAGVMSPFAMKQTLADWNHWVALDQKIAKQRIEEYRIAWKDRIEQASGFYQEVLVRRVASIEEREERKRLAALARIRDGAEFRRMFHERYFNP